jgi:hypothetical protein
LVAVAVGPIEVEVDVVLLLEDEVVVAETVAGVPRVDVENDEEEDDEDDEDDHHDTAMWTLTA